MPPSNNSVSPDVVVSPETDGRLPARSTSEIRWIETLRGNLTVLFRDRADVFVGGNDNWHPLQEKPERCVAPDVYVVFGRPKGERAASRQWEEDDIPLTVTFDVISPPHAVMKMLEKLAFYEDHGVEESYVYDPDNNDLLGFRQGLETLARIRPIHGFVSPRLGITFLTSGPELVVRNPDGTPFLAVEHLEEMRRLTERARDAEEQRDHERQRAARAEQRAVLAEQRAARLGELSQKVVSGQATPEEVAELQRLFKEPSPPAG